MTMLGKLLADAAKYVGRKGEHAAGAPHLLRGVDVASFQGDPGTWRKEAGAIDFAAVKVSEVRVTGSPYLNPFFAADWAYLHQQRKARIAYCFGHPSAPADRTVAYFASEVRRSGLEDGDGICLDHETADSLPPAKVSAWAADVCERLEREFGRKPLVYTDRGFALSGYCASLGRYPLWLADIDHAAGHPQVPRPWKTFAAHQWSWQPLDRDVAPFESIAAMKAALGKPKPKERYVMVTADGKTSLHDLVTPHKVSCMHALRLTLEHDGKWQDDLYSWGNDVLSGRKPGSTPLAKGTQIVVKKAGG